MEDGLHLTIKKLGHEIEEIRIRALDSILTKLNLQIVGEEQLLDLPELFPLLVKWFDFSPAPRKSSVLELIFRLIKTNEGLSLLLRHDPELSQIRSRIGPEEGEIFAKICTIANINVNVRNNAEKKDQKVQNEPNKMSPESVKSSIKSDSSFERIASPRASSPKVELSFRSSLASGNCTFPPTWKQVYWPSPTLAMSDKKVLTTVHNSLREESQREQATHFFSTVVLHDFPPQVFLNDTYILPVLLEIVEKDKNNEKALDCLEGLTNVLLKYFKYYSDASVISQNCFMIDDRNEMDPLGAGDSNQNRNEYFEFSQTIPNSQVLGIGDYCALVLDKVGPLSPNIFSVLSLSISDADLFWNTTSSKAAPLKLTLTSTLSSLGHNLLRAKGISPLKRIHSQIITAKLLKAAVPQSISYTVIPKEMQEALTESLFDPILYLLHPRIHKFFLSYVRSFKYQESNLYNEYEAAAFSLNSGAKFIQCAPKMPVHEMLKCFEDSLLAIEIHKDYTIIELFFDIINNSQDLSQSQIELVQILTTKLLASNDARSKMTSYKIIADLVTLKLGPKANSSESNHYSSLLFVLNKKPLKEIIYYGLSDENSQVRKYSETIIVLLLKSQLLVPSSSWRWLISEISPLFSVLQTYADVNTSLGRTLLSMLDPDKSKQILMPVMEVLTGNIRLMMSKSKECRSEATARVIYLLNIPNHLNINESFSLGENPVSTQSAVYGGYEEGSLIRVLEVLAANNSDPQIVKSALTQLSLIMEDTCLHITFLDYNGLEVVTSYLHSSLADLCDNSKSTFASSVVILKHLARHNAQLRHDFFLNYDIYDSVLKGLYLFNPDWRLVRDISQLLSLMVFSDVVVTTSDAVTFPQPILEKIKIPFEAKPHSQVSSYYQHSNIANILGNKNMKTSLALLWLVESSGGVKEVVNSQMNKSKSLHLPISQVAFEDLSTCCIPYNVSRLLTSLNYSNSHAVAQDTLKDLYVYMKLAQVSNCVSDLGQLPWEKTFLRYLTTLPASVQDQLLLVKIIRFLRFSSELVPELLTWISGIVKDPQFTLNSLLTRVSISDDTALGKEISIEILTLIEVCLKGIPGDWEYIENTLLQCISHSHTQKFYSIAILDKLLKCLLRITELNIYFNPKCLWQLLNAFHCAEAYSCMGLTITRLNILCLTNLLALKPKGKKFRFPPEVKWLGNMMETQDLVVKAATLELLSGLSVEYSPQIINEFPNIWEISLNIILDHNEASLIREQAANLYSNLIASTESKTYVQICVSSQLFSCISLISARLQFLPYLKQNIINDYLFTTSSIHDDNIGGITTPGLFISSCRLILNLMVKDKEAVISALQSQGLAAELFRQVSQWTSCKTLNEQDKVDMYAIVLQVLTHCTHLPATCVKDCIPTLIWLLQDSTYDEKVDKKPLLSSSLKLLGSIASNQKYIDVIFTREAIESLCATTASDDGTTASSVAHLIPFLTSEANVEIVKGLKKCPQSHRFLLASVLGYSHSGTKVALEIGLLDPLIVRLKETHVNLAIMPPDIPRSKKANTVLQNLSIDLCLLINFIAGSIEAKEICVKYGLADIVHKLWAWCLLDVTLISTLLQVLITFTSNCPSAGATLVLTSTMAGVGQRKTPTSSSILHAAIGLLSKDVYGVDLKKMVLELLEHACQAFEARIVMNKCNILSEFVKIGQTRRTSHLEDLEISWLRFFVIFSSYPEGQTSLVKNDDIIEKFLEFLGVGKPETKALSLSILRNLVLTPANKQRFIVSDKLLKTISDRSSDPAITMGELEDILLIAWYLGANSQRGKYALRNVNLDSRLQLALAPYSEESKTSKLAQKVFLIIKPV